MVVVVVNVIAITVYVATTILMSETGGGTTTTRFMPRARACSRRSRRALVRRRAISRATSRATPVMGPINAATPMRQTTPTVPGGLARPGQTWHPRDFWAYHLSAERGGVPRTIGTSLQL